MMHINEENVVYSATTTAIAGVDDDDDETDLRHGRAICGCTNPRLGLLAAGITELVNNCFSIILII